MIHTLLSQHQSGLSGLRCSSQSATKCVWSVAHQLAVPVDRVSGHRCHSSHATFHVIVAERGRFKTA